MHPAPTTQQLPGTGPSGTTQPGTVAKTQRPIPGRIWGVLKVLATLITHARFFTATAATRVDVPEFASAAAVFGTYQLPIILRRIQRGLLRAIALQEYLLARAARGRDLRFAWPPTHEQPHHRRPAPQKRTAPQAPRLRDPALLDPEDPDSLRLPTPEELAAEVRRRPVGRTMVSICLDLGLVPGFCDGDFWDQIYHILRRYGGCFAPLFTLRARREETFQRERDRRPDTWHIDWRDLRPETVRRALGCRFGEPPPVPVPS